MKFPKTLSIFSNPKKSKVKLINNNTKSIYIKDWLLQDNLEKKKYYLGGSKMELKEIKISIR